MQFQIPKENGEMEVWEVEDKRPLYRRFDLIGVIVGCVGIAGMLVVGVAYLNLQNKMNMLFKNDLLLQERIVKNETQEGKFQKEVERFAGEITDKHNTAMQALFKYILAQPTREPAQEPVQEPGYEQKQEAPKKWNPIIGEEIAKANFEDRTRVN